MLAEKRIYKQLLVIALLLKATLCSQSTTAGELFKSSRPLKAGSLVDFVDEAHYNPHIDESHIIDLMKKLKGAGVSVVTWSYYADAQGGHLMPEEGLSGNCRKVYKRLQNPFAKAVKAGHEQDLEVFGYFKPYEMGVDMVFPQGSPEAAKYGLVDRIGGKLVWADPYMAKHPELCIQHRSVTRPEPVNNNPIATIKLYKSNDAPTRIKKENLQIWTSPNNYRYEQKSVDFKLQESIETAPEDVIDLHNNVITRKGDKIRVLALSGLNLTEPYVLVTTNFSEGKPDFVNTATKMLRAFDAGGKEIVGVYCNGFAIYNAAQADFRNWGLMFDHGYGLNTSALDTSNHSGKTGLIAFARGRAPHLGAPCETEPQVRKYWLRQVEEILDAGGDGVEFRIENHSTHTDFPEEYGYNQVILDRLDDPHNPTPAAIAKVRGDAYTEFLIAAKKLIADRGKKMRINFELDKLCGNLPRNRKLAYPANMEMQWRRWIELGLPDEAVFRSFGIPFDQALANPTTQAIADACKAKGIPIHYNRYVGRNSHIMKEIDIIRNDPRFAGFIFYEVCAYINYNKDGTTSFKMPQIPPAMAYAAGCSAAPPTAPGKKPFYYKALPDNEDMLTPGASGWCFAGNAETRVTDESLYEPICKPNPGFVSDILFKVGDTGYYYQDLSKEQEARALANGWKMTVYARIWNLTTITTVRDNAKVNPNFADGVAKSMGFGVVTSAGDSCVGLESIKYQGSPSIGWTVVGLFGSEGVAQTPNDIVDDKKTFPGCYCKYELSWDPKTKLQTLVINYEPGEKGRPAQPMTQTLSNNPAPSSGFARVYFGMPGGMGNASARQVPYYIDSVEFTINSSPR
ncbi:MAG: hypothetical protein JXM70_18815 [Pirellulales bacterium]|nr:hypothetical protein [Pirellulales bacterium]